MSRRKSDPPYRLHKTSGRAVVTLNGRMVYLGKYDSPESREKYHAALAEWHQRGRATPPTPKGPGLTVGELALAYLNHADTYYTSNGQPTGEAATIRHALRPLNRLYAAIPAADFSPVKLQTVRAEMARMGWVRTFINRQVGRIRRMWKWGAQAELVPVGVWQALQTVEGLRMGRMPGVAESERVSTVPQAAVDAVLPLVSAQVADMIRLQLLTGMRPGEVCIMRGADINMQPDEYGNWTYTPTTHKNAYRGQDRCVPLNADAQAIVSKWLKGDPTAYLFSPKEAEAARVAALMAKRKTRRQPSQVKRAARRGKKATRRREPGERYTVNVYRRAIAAACDKAFELPAELVEMKREVSKWAEAFRQKSGRRPKLAELPPELREKKQAVSGYLARHRWHPHQLRHNVGTFVARNGGLEQTKAMLGHDAIESAKVYINKREADHKIASQMAKNLKVG